MTLRTFQINLGMINTKMPPKPAFQKAIIFDSGSLISLAMSSLYEELRELKKIFPGKFLITKEVKQEIIDKPINIKRFELEAMKLNQLINEKIIEMPTTIGVDDNRISRETERILSITNNTFFDKNQPIKIIDLGEASCVALSNLLRESKTESVIATDERTIRLLIENPEALRNILQKRIHIKISIKNENLKEFKNFKIIRSTELMYVAHKKNLVKLKEKNVLDALLYALKFSGCAITDEEIDEIKKM